VRSENVRLFNFLLKKIKQIREIIPKIKQKLKMRDFNVMNPEIIISLG